MQIKNYPLIHFNERPGNTAIDTIVIHSMFAKNTARPCSALNCFIVLDENKVSSHFSIDRQGLVWQHVDASLRAWHAGKSSLPAINESLAHRENVNDFSIGIELIGIWGERFKSRQYRSLANLIWHLSGQFPIRTIVSHQVIAPERKNDPGPSFKWDKLKRDLRNKKLQFRFLE